MEKIEEKQTKTSNGPQNTTQWIMFEKYAPLMKYVLRKGNEFLLH
jgi:hypothetical protein